MKRKYEPSYDVTLTLKLRTIVDFARGTPAMDEEDITKQDAIENAWGLIGNDTMAQLEDEFSISAFDGEAELIDHIEIKHIPHIEYDAPHHLGGDAYLSCSCGWFNKGTTDWEEHIK